MILIKHAMPEIIPDQPPKTWKLGDLGRRQARALAEWLRPYSPAMMITSMEPKASVTGQIVSEALDIPYQAAAGLHEHDRTGEPYYPFAEFQAKVQSFFAQPDTLVFGSETAQATRTRFKAALLDVVQQNPRGNLAICAHGTVISLFVTDVAHVEPFSLWKRLSTPSFVVLTWPEGKIDAVIEQVEV